MLEHYHMSFLLTTENGNFLLYPIMFKNQILYKADGLHSDVQEPWASRILCLFSYSFSNTLIPGCGISGYDWTGTCLLWQFMNLPCFLVSSFSFFTVIGGPTEVSGDFLLWSCINSEIVYKRPLVSPLVTILQTQAQHWRQHALYTYFYIFTHL